MRLRNVPGSREYIENSPYAIKDAETLKGSWRSYFEKNEDMPLFIEIGTGKGRFLTEHAANNPNTLYVGIEKFSSVIIRAIEKVETLELNNLRLIRFDAENIESYLTKERLTEFILIFRTPG